MSVRRSVMRVLLALLAVTAGGVAWADLVDAAPGKEINATADAAKCDKTWGPPCFTPSNGTVTQVTQGETVTWRSLDGTHTVTPVDGSAFAGSGDLTGPDATYSVTFDKVGTFSFYCRHHGSVEDGGKTHHGMWGRIEVKAGDGTTTTTAPPAPPPGNQPPPGPDPGPPPAPGPTHPPSPPPTQGSPPPSSSGGSAGGQNSSGQTAAGTGRPYVGPPPTQAAPPPTRTAFAGPPATEPPREKEKERGSSSDNSSPPEATAVPPDEAVLPPSPQFPTATTAPVAQNPADVPHGDTIAVLKNEQGGHKRKLVLFGTIFGMGAFAAGVGGWKYMNRSSRYWPA